MPLKGLILMEIEARSHGVVIAKGHGIQKKLAGNFIGNQQIFFKKNLTERAALFKPLLRGQGAIIFG